MNTMKPARDWREELCALPPSDTVERVQGRGGEDTLISGAVYLHSRYRPVEEAQRLIDSAELDPARPVLVLGAGLGYHLRELLERKIEIAVIEPDPQVAKLALEEVLGERETLFGIGDADDVVASAPFQQFAARLPQILLHPATARLHPLYVNHLQRLVSKTALGNQRLRIAVVGPMYGGSLPIARHLVDGFEEAGHNVRFVDNSIGWPMYDAVLNGTKSQKTSDQLGAILANFMEQWSYAQVMEFAPEICVVLAQAPVTAVFPQRLAKENIATAYWFVENWRHFPYWKETAPYYDCFFHLQPGEFDTMLDEIGCTVHPHLQTACNPAAHKPVTHGEHEQEKFQCDLSFAGAGYYNRNQFFQGLTDYDFKIWGVDWQASRLQPLLCDDGERFTPEKFAKIVAGSKINLNLHSSTSHPGVDPNSDAINPRVFETAACGGFQLCDASRGLENFFDPASELPTYRSLEELRALLDHYLSHDDERRTIAQAARERVLRDHTYAVRARQMLDHVLEHCGARMLKKGVRIERSTSEMSERVGVDTELGEFLQALPPDTPFTQDGVNAELRHGLEARNRAEQLFGYLKEVRSSAEALLAMKD
jgi:spore maturation protein CgeB